MKQIDVRKKSHFEDKEKTFSKNFKVKLKAPNFVVSIYLTAKFFFHKRVEGVEGG